MNDYGITVAESALRTRKLIDKVVNRFEIRP
jgi:hypothetical protein